MYGLRPTVQPYEADEYLSKHWRVSSNDSGLTAALDLRCDGSHRHIETSGSETAATAFYPRPLALAVHKALRSWATCGTTRTTEPLGRS